MKRIASATREVPAGVHCHLPIAINVVSEQHCSTKFCSLLCIRVTTENVGLALEPEDPLYIKGWEVCACVCTRV